MTLRFADSSVMYWLKVGLNAQLLGSEVSPAAMYSALELYYLNNGVYDAVSQSNFDKGIWTEAMKGFRNPAHRVVEFYVSKICPGQLPAALPIITTNKAIVDPIHQIWQWSNWGTQKQLAVRWFALFGDLFVKTATRLDDSGSVDQVYFQIIKPYYVTDFDVDERGFLVYIRLDIPQNRRINEKSESYLHTEIWDKSAGLYRLWEHKRSASTPPDQLGTPVIAQPLESMGIDFIPFVHAKFQDIGDKRGIGSFTHALDKIDEANRAATRLHQMLFRYNRPLWAVSANGNDPTGRPLPGPRVGNENPGTVNSDTLTLADDTLLRLPGMSNITALVPNLQYDSALAILQDHMLELERDLPELAYYRVREKGGDLSGRAIRFMLSDAVDKATEARGNFESALARMDSMALTVGINANLFDSSLGTFEAGDFDHTFADRPVIPLSEFEQAELITAEVNAKIPLKTALRRRGWTEDEIEQMAKDRDQEIQNNQQSFADGLANVQRRFGGENPQNPPENQNSPQPGVFERGS